MLSLLVGAVAAAGGSSLHSLRGGSAEPLQLISASGELLSSSATAIAGAVPGSSSLSVVASVGGNQRGRRLLNALFGTEYPTALALGAPDADSAGAWLAASSSVPGCVVLEQRPLAASGQQRSAVDSCKLTCFSLVLADAVLVHSPCVAPSLALLRESYERIFSHHLAAMPSGADAPTTLLHVSDPAGGVSEATVREACRAAWETAAAATEFKGMSFSDLFTLDVVDVPTEAEDAAGFAAGVAALKAKLGRLGSKVGKPSGLADAVKTAWDAAGSTLDGEPSEDWLTERYLAARSYEAAYSEAQACRPRAPPPPAAPTRRPRVPPPQKGRACGSGSAAPTPAAPATR